MMQARLYESPPGALVLAASLLVGIPPSTLARADPGELLGPQNGSESAQAGEQDEEGEATEEGKVEVEYSNGLEVTTADGNYRAHVELRLQGRFSSPFDSDPRTMEQFEAPDESTFEVRRGRLKIGGHAYRPWLEFYFEHDFPSNRLLDFRLTLSKLEWLQLRVGQGKAIYNRERVASSGKQQFAERSIVTRAFTIDRQQGVQLFGHLMPGTRGDSWYYAGVFSGNGRGAANDDDHLMWMGRYQWNFLGRDLKYSQSDVERHQQPTGSLAVAAVTNRSRFTRFSSGGGGQLDGFEDGEPGQYAVDQWLAELAFKLRGFSWLHEVHWKDIDDQVNRTRTRLEGSFVQAGYFFHELWPAVPEELEIAARWAFVDPDTSVPDDRRRELSVGVNWFFAGHRNKLTVDASRLTLEVPGGADLTEDRVRVQWDVSF